ncbi:MAG: class I SAM-dependent methyltransferase [Clostridia bacterium]|nr:class I SAM-dependent methyltransferase [Clostridia bacterium]
MDNTTALVSCFARAYHAAHGARVFSDPTAKALLGADCGKIAAHMTAGIPYFLGEFRGTPEEGLCRIVHERLAPAVLARSAFFLAAAETERRLGLKQVLLLGAGYDGFGMRAESEGLSVFALDRAETLRDVAARCDAAGLENRAVPVPCDLGCGGWDKRLRGKGFRSGQKSLAAGLGLCHYLGKEAFAALVMTLGNLLCAGSALVFDVPTDAESERDATLRDLAAAAGEPMRARYSERELTRILSAGGFALYEWADADALTKRFFKEHNADAPDNAMRVPAGTACILAVKR